MPAAAGQVEVTLTGIGHFRRLVDFLAQVDQLAVDRDDVELGKLVTSCSDDLHELSA